MAALRIMLLHTCARYGCWMPQVEHVLREFNKDADALSNLAMDMSVKQHQQQLTSV